jgi:hypothetical protein
MLTRLLLLGGAAIAHASYEAIAGYYPNSAVTDHNAIDLDQRDFEAALADSDYAAATAIYQNGGHSKSYARITLAGTLANAYASGSTCTMKDSSNNDMVGSLKSGVSVGAGTIDCLYPTGSVQASYQFCQVGGLETATQVTSGCIDTTKNVVMGTNTETFSITSAVNKNGRTLQGFAETETNEKKMYVSSTSCTGCPYEAYSAYHAYYGQHGWADLWVSAALAGTSLTLGSGTSYSKVADFSTQGYNDLNTRKEAAKKGTAFMNVWMYVIREFEDAIDDCSAGTLNNNYNSVHAWDEGVAFYAGSAEGTSVASAITNTGYLPHNLADKRCAQFDTCNSDESNGKSKVNSELLTLFQRGRNLLMVLDCAAVRPIVTEIQSLMTIPLIQGTLRYTFWMSEYTASAAVNSAEMLKYNAEGATFAFAVLPLLAKCSASAARTVYDNLKLGVQAGFAGTGTGVGGGNAQFINKDAVKVAFEANYECMGLTCADIGALNTAGGCTDNNAWCTMCSDSSTNSLATATLSYEKIAGYTPRSPVTDHNAIDLDQSALVAQLGAENAAGFANAKAIYENGGNSKSYAVFTVPGTDTAGAATPAFAVGTEVIGRSAVGTTVYGTVKSAASAGALELKVTYKTTNVQATYNGQCQVGSLVTTTTTGCFHENFTITVGYVGINPTAVSNLAGRTLQGFASLSTVTSKMWVQSTSCPNCPYDTFSKFYTYYGDLTYADMYVTAALDGTATSFTNLGNVDYSSTTQGTSYKGRKDATKKGTVFLNNWMYVIREFEDAIDDCSTSSITNNYGSAHAWDEGVAFYTGTAEGTAVGGSGAGVMNYNLAEKRCQNFNTCIDGTTGMSSVNLNLFAKFDLAQNYLFTGSCSYVRPVLDEIIPLMTIPHVQGVLRYAYSLSILESSVSATDDGRLKKEGEGATFAAAMLPLLHACSAADAAIVQSNMAPGASMSMDRDAVKAALERNYLCMGIVCADVGALTEAGGCLPADVGGWCSVCTDPSPPPPPVVVINTTTTVTKEKDKLSAGAIAGIAIAAVVALVFLICVLVLVMKEKKGQPMFASIQAPGQSTTKGPPA